jgi:hypothetical protein
MSFEFRDAKREAVGLLIGLSGGTGSGKTFSALRLANGLAGGGTIAMIDTEAGRAKHYADRFAFKHGDLKPPFTPDRYTDWIKAADDAGFAVIVVDSASHEYAGEGGVLDMQEAELQRMAGTDYQRRESCKLASWIQPKMAHKHFVSRLLQVRAHLILCFRAEPKVDMKRGANGRMEIVPKVGLTALDGWFPVCEKNLPYELTASFLLKAEHPGHPLAIKLEEQHRRFFPPDQPITEDAGRLLAAWARGEETNPQDATMLPTPRTTEAREVDLYATLINACETIVALEGVGEQIKKLPKARRELLRAAYAAKKRELSLVEIDAARAREVV